MPLTSSSRPGRDEEAGKFRAALEEISARGARALRLRYVEGKSRDDCAAFFGISRASFDVMLLRGSRELAAELHRAPTHRPTSAALEYQEAERLAASFDEQRKVAGELDALRSMLEQLAELSSDIRAQDAQALLDTELSPAGRRRALLWRALFLAIVGAALFLYFRPRPASPVLTRVPREELR